MFRECFAWLKITRMSFCFLKDPKKTIRVKQSGQTLQEWEAAARKAKWESSEKGSEPAEPVCSTDERAAIVCAAVRGSQHDKRTIDALENLLGKQVMKVESIVSGPEHPCFYSLL
jgi:hypothetical protein